MAAGDVKFEFEGEYGITVVLTLNKDIESIAMEVDTYDEEGVFTHTFFSREEAISMAKTILEVLE